jgi:Uma2 family endonuclease
MNSQPDFHRYRLTVRDFHRIAEAGVIAPDARVELIDGEMYEMAPIGTAHAAIVDRLTAALFRAAGNDWIVRVQNPVVLDDRTELYPDLAVVRRRDDDYVCTAPTAVDSVLLIEVGDTTVNADRRIKLPRYLARGAPEVWLVAIPERRVIVTTADGSSSSVDTGPLSCPALPALALSCEQLFRGL